MLNNRYFSQELVQRWRNIFLVIYFSGRKDEDDRDIQLQAGMHNTNEPPKEVTHTVVELNQPLLENEIN